QNLTISAATGGSEAGSTPESYTLTVKPIAENPESSGAVETSANEKGGLFTLGASVATHDAEDGPISVTIAGLAGDLSDFNGGTRSGGRRGGEGWGGGVYALPFKGRGDGEEKLDVYSAPRRSGACVELARYQPA